MSLNLNNLNEVAEAMVAPGKGILAADESTGTIGKRFDQIDTESTEQTRNAYRDLLFSSDGFEEYISGVIMYDETLRQSSLKDNSPYPEYLTSLGVIPGLKLMLEPILLQVQKMKKLLQALTVLMKGYKSTESLGLVLRSGER